MEAKKLRENNIGQSSYPVPASIAEFEAQRTGSRFCVGEPLALEACLGEGFSWLWKGVLHEIAADLFVGLAELVEVVS